MICYCIISISIFSLVHFCPKNHAEILFPSFCCSLVHWSCIQQQWLMLSGDDSLLSVPNASFKVSRKLQNRYITKAQWQQVWFGLQIRLEKFFKKILVKRFLSRICQFSRISFEKMSFEKIFFAKISFEKIFFQKYSLSRKFSSWRFFQEDFSFQKISFKKIFFKEDFL